MKDKLLHNGGVMNFLITKKVLTVCSQAQAKCKAALEKKREAETAEVERAKKDIEWVKMNKIVAMKLSDLDRKIRGECLIWVIL